MVDLTPSYSIANMFVIKSNEDVSLVQYELEQWIQNQPEFLDIYHEGKFVSSVKISQDSLALFLPEPIRNQDIESVEKLVKEFFDTFEYDLDPSIKPKYLGHKLVLAKVLTY